MSSAELVAAAPPATAVFDPIVDRYGLRLALVFGNHAPGGRCPYYVGGRCHHCDIGAGEGRAFDARTNLARLAWFEQRYAVILDKVAHLVIYNSGSALNRRELPREVLGDILAFGRGLPQLGVVSIDSREAFITEESVGFACAGAGEGRVVRPILGIETSDSHARNVLLDKRMPARAVCRAFDAIAAVGRALGPERVGIDVNVVVGGPGTTPADAAQEAARTAREMFGLARARGLAIDLNLHPYYPSIRGRARFPDQPRCSFEVLVGAVKAICRERSRLAPEAGLFLGLDDEGHDTEAGSAPNDEGVQAALEAFHRTQDPTALAPLG